PRAVSRGTCASRTSRLPKSCRPDLRSSRDGVQRIRAMGKVVTYYMTVVSPWTYFGHDRLVALCAKHGATIEMKPVDLGRIFPLSGGLPLKQRAPQRQAYRLVELARWKALLAMPFNAQPKFAASGPELSARWILAASER